jgi:hypothetical protein
MRYEFVHLQPFSSKAARLHLSLEDVRAIEFAIMENPATCPIMQGTGGLRKMRFAPGASGGGKSGGIRVCYFILDSKDRIYLVTLFAKNEKDNLSKADRNAIAGWIAAIRKVET